MFLRPWVELNKIGITPITERKLIGYLKGAYIWLYENSTEFMQTPVRTTFGAEKEKKDLSVKLLSVIFKQCVEKQWLISDFFTCRFQSHAGYQQTLIHNVGHEVLQSRVVDVPCTTTVFDAIGHVRRSEDRFICTLVDSTAVSAPRCSKHGKKYKQVQPQVEAMLKSKSVEIISCEQFIFLGFQTWLLKTSSLCRCSRCWGLSWKWELQFYLG